MAARSLRMALISFQPLSCWTISKLERNAFHANPSQVDSVVDAVSLLADMVVFRDPELVPPVVVFIEGKVVCIAAMDWLCFYAA